MKFFTYIFIIILFVSASTAFTQSNDTVILPNVLTFNFSFGDEFSGDEEEYLFARPERPVILNNGNILIPDEYKIKVYDKNGKPLKLLGAKGQGPGEFSQSPNSIFISSRGEIIATPFGTIFNYYDNSLNFLKTENMRTRNVFESLKSSQNIANTRIIHLYKITDNDIIYTLSAQKIIGNQQDISDFKAKTSTDKTHYFVVRIAGNETKVIDNYSYSQRVSYKTNNETGWTFLPFKGYLYFNNLENGKIVYSHSEVDRENNNGQFNYLLKYFNSNNNISSIITKEYIRIEIPDSLIKRYKNPTSERTKAAAPTQIASINKYPYLPPIRNLIVDGNIVFAQTNFQNENGEYLVDIFDGDSEKYLQSIYLSFQFFKIKNGKLYNLVVGRNVFSRIDVYTIDPKVYQKN